MAEALHPAAARIKYVLACDDETAEAVRRKLGAPFDDPNVRQFIAIAWKLGQTTRGRGEDHTDMAIAEGKRQAALFMASCAGRLLEPETYQAPTTERE